jgi:hypothetical protein
MRLGAVAASVLGAGAAWWLGGNTLLLAAVGGIATALALPYVSKAMSQVAPAFEVRNGRPVSLEVGTRNPSVAKTEAAHGGPMQATKSEDSEVNDETLGGLTPIAEILPVGKRPVTKSRP